MALPKGASTDTTLIDSDKVGLAQAYLEIVCSLTIAQC